MRCNFALSLPAPILACQHERCTGERRCAGKAQCNRAVAQLHTTQLRQTMIWRCHASAGPSSRSEIGNNFRAAPRQARLRWEREKADQPRSSFARHPGHTETPPQPHPFHPLPSIRLPPSLLHSLHCTHPTAMVMRCCERPPRAPPKKNTPDKKGPRTGLQAEEVLRKARTPRNGEQK